MMYDSEAKSDSIQVTAQARVRSEIEFPYIDLDQAITVAETVHQQFGTRCLPEQLSGAMGIKGGAFARRIGGARMFGLTEKDAGEIRLTELGRRIVDSRSQAASRAAAFLSVELYKALYDEFRSTSLPSDPGLESQMSRLGVPEKQAGTARQIFKRSARQAGFFQFGEDRLIMPALKNADPLPTDFIEPERPVVDADDTPPKREHGLATPSVPQLPALHPALVHALETLPKTGEEWGYDDLEDWLDGFKGVLRLVYKVKRPSNF